LTPMPDTLNDLAKHSEIQPFSDPLVARASEWIRLNDSSTIGWQVELTEIPAPPFCEGPRGDWIAERFGELGLSGVRRDSVGNVLGWLSGEGTDPLIVSAHLDTVFPPETDVTVTREGDLLRGPGISDDGRGLAALLTLAGAFQATGLKTETPVLLVATVGEEGLGDLRGVKHLFREGGPGAAASGFVSLDGAGITRIVSSGVGSFRFRATISGRGGHSWVDFGTPNPIHALAEAICEWTSLELPQNPTSTLTIARTGGGTSINAIPEKAWAEVDIRSADATIMTDLARAAQRIVESAVIAASDGADEAHELSLDFEVLGERPPGACDPFTPLLHVARAATEAVGSTPRTVSASTDANVPMSLAIPAVTLGAGGNAGLAHTTEEWFRNVRGAEGIVRGLLTIVGFAGIRN
jgi:tripeptide aminopeptidase